MTPPWLHATQGEYRVSTDPAQLDLVAIHAYLTRSYWAAGIPAETVERSLSGSLCFGLYHAPQGQRSNQVGLARIVTDGATFAYLCDVYVLEAHRGRGLGKWLLQEVMRHRAVSGLRRFMLATRDAHSLYAPLGFVPVHAPERLMEILLPEVYKPHPWAEPAVTVAVSVLQQQVP